MGTLLDIFGSSFIGGLLLLLIMKLNLFMSNSGYSSDNELRMQQNAKTLAEIVNYDFRKIGYKFTGSPILAAGKENIKFVGDLEKPGEAGHGVVDTVEYFIKNSSFSTGSSNPDDIILVRVLNNTDTLAGPSLGLVKLNFSYLDSLSAPTANLSEIKFVKTELWVEPLDQVTNMVTGNKDSVFTYWEFTIHPRNI